MFGTDTSKAAMQLLKKAKKIGALKFFRPSRFMRYAVMTPQLFIQNRDKEKRMSNLKRYDPFDELFRGFFVRPVNIG